MNCRKVNSLLSAYIDGELTGRDQLQVRDHLRSCYQCTDEHDSLEQTKRILARLSNRTPDPALEDRILQRIAEEARRPALATAVRGWWTLLAEPDRAALRSGAVFGIVALAALLYLRLPVPKPQSNSGLMANRPVVPMVRPQPEFQPPAALNDMYVIHSVGGAGQPVSAPVTPVSNPSVGTGP